MILNVLSIDVEDWFHLFDAENNFTISDWHQLESRVEINTRKILNILEEHDGVKATFFVLGWIAEQFPQLVLEIKHHGHEIASHGYGHQLIYKQTPDEFRIDIAKSKLILESIVQQHILGYRAPAYSIKNESRWALDIIKEVGFVYDSSIFSAARWYGGLKGEPIYPYQYPSGLWEFPISMIKFLRINIPFSGGGYFRFFPYSFIKKAIKSINNNQKPVVIYLHPREVDVLHPKFDMPLHRRFRCYVNLHSTEKKLHALLSDFKFAPIREVLALS